MNDRDILLGALASMGETEPASPYSAAEMEAARLITVHGSVPAAIEALQAVRLDGLPLAALSSLLRRVGDEAVIGSPHL